MKKILITTFNKKLFDKYAHKLLQTYIDTQQTLPLYCYVEDDVNLYPKFKNVVFLNLFENQPENKKFVDRNFKKFEKTAKITYLLDAVKFSYKVFAQNDARKYGDHIFFIDADTYFIKQIPDSWYIECLPENVFLSIYERLGYYTETGFIAINNKIVNKKGIKFSEMFFHKFVNYYIKDFIYCLPTFIDSVVFDITRNHFLYLRHSVLEYENYLEKRLGDYKLWHSTGKKDVMQSDNFINKYMIHNKGLDKFK